MDKTDSEGAEGSSSTTTSTKQEIKSNSSSAINIQPLETTLNPNTNTNTTNPNHEIPQTHTHRLSSLSSALSHSQSQRSQRRPRRYSTDVGSILARHESIIDASSLASIDRPPSDETKLPYTKIYHPYSFHVLALLAPASIFGVLARLGIQALVGYDEKSIFPLAWVQSMGCLCMGFALGIKEPLGQFYGPLYTALTTGFCGSLTTFSGWQFDIFQSWLNPTHANRDWLRDVIDGLSKSLFTLALSLSSVSFGAHLASLLLRSSKSRSIRLFSTVLPSNPPSKIIRYSLSIIALLSYLATIPIYFKLSPSFRHQATSSLLFSYPGTLSRYLLSINLNPLLKAFPLGTFTANSCGTALLGIFHVCLGLGIVQVSSNACDVLQGLADGYCGCLTTVSTFAAEVDALEDWKAWRYVILSWVTAQLLLLVILGTAYWGSGVSEQTTCVFSI
ncbi:fluoride channel Fluc/FEX family protein [Abortiporus biennis]